MKNFHSNPDAENQYLHTCLSALLDGSSEFPAAPTGLNWDKFYAELVRHRLVGLFAARARHSPVSWPVAVVECLRRERVLALLSGNAFADDLSRVLAAMRAAGVPVIVLKGWALIPGMYHNDPSQRAFSDADLLVPLASAAHGERVLREQGYTISDETWPGFNQRYGIHIQLGNSQPVSPFLRRFPIELHWGLMHIPFLNQRIDLEGIFQRAVPLQIKGESGLALAPEDHLVYTCAHLLHHRCEFVLARWFELALWLGQHAAQLDWQAVLDRAHHWRFASGIQYAFINLELLWPGTIPAAVFDQVGSLRPGFTERIILQLEESGSPVFKTLVVFATLPFPKKNGYLFQSLFPNPDYLETRYGPAPLNIWPLLYFRRAGRVFGFIAQLFRRKNAIKAKS